MAFNIGIVGTGYVGIVSGSTFAETGNSVICIDIDKDKVNQMRQGIPPIYEPGLEHLMKRNIQEKRLVFSSDLRKAVLHSEIIFLCLPTPPNEDGSADLQHVLKVASDIASIYKSESLSKELIVVNKSTVPVGTADKVSAIFDSTLGDENSIEVISNPEFLREGFAIDDAMKPDRVVIGAKSQAAGEKMKQLYKPFVMSGNPILIMDQKSAEVTKYAANSFLAAKISFMNDLARYCEQVDADIDNVRSGVGTDNRIGKRFLFAGLGYGGSCFPKDVRALGFSAVENNSQLSIIEATKKINNEQPLFFISKIIKRLGNDLSGKSISIWGLAFKPNTDDVREAPAFIVIEDLLKRGARIKVYDPEAMKNTELTFGDRIEYAKSQYDALIDSDALVIVTEWGVFRTPDLR